MRPGGALQAGIALERGSVRRLLAARRRGQLGELALQLIEEAHVRGRAGERGLGPFGIAPRGGGIGRTAGRRRQHAAEGEHEDEPAERQVAGTHHRSPGAAGAGSKHAARAGGSAELYQASSEAWL
jgi:hypothetical protein